MGDVGECINQMDGQTDGGSKSKHDVNHSPVGVNVSELFHNERGLILSCTSYSTRNIIEILIQFLFSREYAHHSVPPM